MASSWRAALSDYVYEMNRLESERGGQAGKPVRTETRAKPIHVAEQDRLALVRLSLHKKRIHEDGRSEERIEREKLTLILKKGSWMITKIDPEVPERAANARVGTELFSTKASLPFINRQVLDKRNGPDRAIRYNRLAVRHYAESYWNTPNPKYHEFEVDCTNFVSQCLFAGGIPMNYTGRRDSGWWYEGYIGGNERWSYSWAVAHSFQTYLLSSRRGIQVDDPRKLTIGDIISYDWEGDSRFTHSTIVTGMDSSGFPLVNAHTNNSRNRYWDYRDSYAWTERTRYTFIHIPDVL